MINWDHTPNHLYNFYDQENHEQAKTFTTGPIVRTAQGHTKVNLPNELCIDPTDQIGFYLEYVDPEQKHVRRICKVFTAEHFQNLSKKEQVQFNIRKVRPMAGNKFNVILPTKALKVPTPKQWTHIIFHYSSDPNIYFMEFKDLSQLPKPKEAPINEEETKITYAQNPFESPGIRWD